MQHCEQTSSPKVYFAMGFMLFSKLNGGTIVPNSDAVAAREVS